MFARKDRSPTPLRTNYDFTLRHERSKLFHRIVTQVDGHAARTSQALRDLVACFSQVGQSYYEVSLCVNNVNPSTASILQARRASAEDDVEEATGNEAEFSLATAARRTGRLRNFEKRQGLVVAHKGREGDISYQDGVVQEYGAGLQTAAQLFATETRGLKEGKLFATYSEGVHKDVLARLKEVETSAKQTVESGNETEKYMRKFMQAKKLVTLKEKKYERLGKPLSESKRYNKQVAEMKAAEEVYLAKLNTFDERYEHLFQRDLYVTGHTLDNFLDVNFTFMAHLMRVVGSLAPSAPDTMEKVVVEGGEALGKRMGVAEEDRIGSRIKGRRGSGPTPNHAAATANRTDPSKDPAGNPKTPAAARRPKADPTSSHNFTNYFSTRREVRQPAAAALAHAKHSKQNSEIVDLDEAPPTAKNNDETSHVKPVVSPKAKATKPTVAPAKKPPAGSKPAAAAAAAVAKTGRAFTPSDDEPEPRIPQGVSAGGVAGGCRTPVREHSNAPFGDTPNVLHGPHEHSRPMNVNANKMSNQDANTKKPIVKRDPSVSQVPTIAEHLTGHNLANKPLIMKRNPSLSPSCEPFGYPELRDEVRAASVMYTVCSRVQGRRDSGEGEATDHDVVVGTVREPNVETKKEDAVKPSPAVAVAVAATAKPSPAALAPVKNEPATKAPVPQTRQTPAVKTTNPLKAPPAPAPTNRGTGANKPAPVKKHPQPVTPRKPAEATTPRAKPATTTTPTTTAPAAAQSRPSSAAPVVGATALPKKTNPVVSAPPPDETETDGTPSLLSSVKDSGLSSQAVDARASAAEANPGARPLASSGMQGGKTSLGSLANSLNLSPSGASFGLGLPRTASTSGGCEDDATQGRPTVAAVPSVPLKGFSNGSFPSMGFSGHTHADPFRMSGGTGAMSNGHPQDGSLSLGLTPQGQNISGTSTPPPQGTAAGGAANPFYTEAWEAVNLTKDSE